MRPLGVLSRGRLRGHSYKCPAALYEAALLLEAALRTITLANGRPLPKAGVFAQGEARVVARRDAPIATAPPR